MNTTQASLQNRERDTHRSMSGSYGRFFAMIGTSTVTMFFLMYLHSYQLLDHARFSETRLFMTLIMAAAMMVIMLGFMLNMYKSKKVNTAIFLSAIALFSASLWLVRSQVTVSDVDWMEGMIPHHSIAILTSERAQIEDVRVRELADAIVRVQRKEIKEMEWLIADIRENGAAETADQAAPRPLPEFSGSV